MNRKKYYLYQLFNELMPIYPLYLLLFESKGLTVTQISLLLAIWSLPGIVLEIPSGILADRWSRKNLIVLGAILKALCYLFWFFSEGFLLYAIGFILWGVGGSFASGSEEALLYDSMKTEGQEDNYEKVLGKGRFISGVSTIAASIIGGVIGKSFGFEAALLLSIISGILSGTVALAFQEKNLYRERLQELSEEKEDATLRNALGFLLHNKEIMLFTLMTLLVITTVGILDEYDQLIAKEYGLTVSAIGIWTAILFALIAFGSYIAHGLRTMIEKIFRMKDIMYQVGSLCMVAAGLLIIAGLVRHFGIMVLYGLYYLIMAAGSVMQEDYVQQKIEAEGRSTVHSLISLSQNLYGMICYGLFGFLLTRTDLHGGLVWCGVYIVFWTLVLGALYLLYSKSSIFHREI